MAIGGKPFSLQAPEQIAKEYGGDKQRIMQAAQMGVVDPTAALMAAMFIDRIRTAQTAEQSAPSTVAQDVFAPPAPAGLGAMPAPMQAAPGMAQPTPPAGGIEALPVPEAMFPEEGAGMAGGGIVAFQSGGGIDFNRFRNAIIQQESSGDYGVVNRQSGAMGAYQFMPATAQAIARRLGLPYRPELMQGEGGRSEEGRAYQDQLGREQLRDAIQFSGGDLGRAAIYHFAGPDQSKWGPLTREYRADILRRYGAEDTEPAPVTGTPPITIEEFQQLVTPRNQRGLEGNVEMFRQIFDQYLPDTSAIEETIADLRSRNTPEEAKAQREQDLWSALADFGFKWAASGNLAQSAGETFSGLRETLDSRREEELDNLTRIIQLEGMQIDRAMPAIEAGAAAYENERQAERDARQQTATYVTNMGTTNAGIAGRIQEALLTPDTSGAMTTSQADSYIGQVEDAFELLDTGVDEGAAVPAAIRQLHEAVKAGTISAEDAMLQGARYYANLSAALRGNTGAGTGAGAGTPTPPAGFVMEGGPRLSAAPASGSAGNAWQNMMRGITSPR